jgi:hypothetical protein
MVSISRTKRAWLTALAAILLIGFALWASNYHAWEFKGGLSITDSGFFSNPRYYAQIGRLPMWKAGEYQFRLRGLPPGPLELALPVLEATDADRAVLSSLSTIVSVTITDSSGNQMCTAKGRLRVSTDDPWILFPHSTTFWHPRCTNIRTSRFRSYIVNVAVSDVDPRSPSLNLMLVLRGGGNELP